MKNVNRSTVNRYTPPIDRDTNKDRTQGSRVGISINDTPTEATPKNTRHAARRPQAMTGKQREYVRIMTTEPTVTKRDAIRRVYDVKPDVSVKTLDKMIARTEKSKPVLATLTAFSERSELLLRQLTEQSVTYAMQGGKDGASYATVAERSLNSVLDRVHGKAKQSMDVSVKAVNVNVDLSS